MPEVNPVARLHGRSAPPLERRNGSSPPRRAPARRSPGRSLVRSRALLQSPPRLALPRPFFLTPLEGEIGIGSALNRTSVCDESRRFLANQVDRKRDDAGKSMFGEDF